MGIAHKQTVCFGNETCAEHRAVEVDKLGLTQGGKTVNLLQLDQQLLDPVIVGLGLERAHKYHRRTLGGSRRRLSATSGQAS